MPRDTWAAAREELVGLNLQLVRLLNITVTLSLLLHSYMHGSGNDY